jgi:hypothetical protein
MASSFGNRILLLEDEDNNDEDAFAKSGIGGTTSAEWQ